MIEFQDCDEFVKTIEKGNYLIDFWAEWCGPCKMVAPILEQVENEVDGLTLVKINADECPEIMEEFSIVSIPTIMYFKDGQFVDQIVGAAPKQRFIEMVS